MQQVRIQKYRCRILLLLPALLMVLYASNKTRQERDVILQTSQINSTKNTPLGAVQSSGDSPRTSIVLFVAILTHWRRRKRRESIRDTWMTQCKHNQKAICLFFTDYVGASEEEKRLLENEISENEDIIAMPMIARFAFAARLLWIMQWTSGRYNYEYLLRIDDDHFLCFERLLLELSHRPSKALYWGFVHCKPTLVRVDEAWLILTNDLVREILTKANTTLPCHPYGDQAVALWMNNSTYNVTYFMDNQRIVHKTAGHDPKYFTRTVCEEYLSLHGIFDQEMRKLWLVWYKLYRARLPSVPQYNITPLMAFEKLCPHSQVFSTQGFYPEFRYDPKPCRTNPTWSISRHEHLGREDAGERYSSY